MSFASGTPVWALHNGTWRPAAVAPPVEGVAGTNLVFVDTSTATVPDEAVEPFDVDNTQRQVDPLVKAEVVAFVDMLNLSQNAAAAEDDDSASSSSSEDDETEGQATQPAEDDDDATRQLKLDKKAKKALKKEKKKEKKRDKKEKKKDKAEKKLKKDKKEASQNDAEDDEDLLGIVDATSPSKDKKDKKKDKKKKEKKSKKDKKEKRRHEAEMSQTQDDSSEEEDEEESEDEMGLRASDLNDSAVRNVSRFRGSGGGGASYSSQRALGSQSGPIIPHSASDLVLHRAEQTSRPTPMNLQGGDRRLLTDLNLDNVASQLKGLSTYYKAEVTKLSMGTISAGTGMTQSQGQVMPISEVDYLRAAERRLTSHRNALRILQFRQAQMILKYRENIDQDDVDDYRHRIATLATAITKEAKYNVTEVFMKADAEAKVASNNSVTTHPGIPNLRPVLYHRTDEPYEKTGVRHHQFSYIDKICEPASEMHLKAVSTIQTIPSKLQADEIRRRQLDPTEKDHVEERIPFNLGSTLPARLKGSIDGTTSSRPLGSTGLESLMTSSTLRGEASNVRVMTQWRAFRDFDVDTQKKRNHNPMEDYLTTTRPQDVHPPTFTSRNFDFGAQRLDERAEKRATHVLNRVMSTQNLGGASGTGQMSLSNLLLGGASTQLGATSSTNLPASEIVRTLTQGAISQLNITDFGVSRNLKNKQARLDAESSGLLSQSGQEVDAASVYSSLGMDSEKSVNFEGFNGVGNVGMAPVDFGFDVEDAFKSQMVDPGYPDISEIKDLRHVKSVDLPSVGPASEGIDSQASSWQEAHDERHRPIATVGAGIASQNDQFNDAVQQRSPSPNAASPASNMIRDLLVTECRSVYNKVKSILSEAKKRGTPDLAVSGGGTSATVLFSISRLNGLHSCLITPVQLKTVITTLRDRILKTPEIQKILADFYSKNEASTEIPASVLLPQNTQQRIRASLMSYLARQYEIPPNGLQGMRLQRKSAASQPTTGTQHQAEAAAQAPGSRRPRQSTYAYDE